MAEEYSNLEERDKIKAENEFLKMKLLLEHGASLDFSSDAEFPVEVENQFLNNILEFEKSYKERRLVSVFNKIGQPNQFKPVNEIADDMIVEAWEELEQYLGRNRIELHACSPNIGKRELYRFVTEELFIQEMDDIPAAGWTTTFIYDEFHPDPVYESEKAVEKELFPELFNAKPTSEYFHCFHWEDIEINGRKYAREEDFVAAMNFLKSFYSKLKLQQFRMRPARKLSEENVIVTGNYEAIGYTVDAHTPVLFEGKFRAYLTFSDLGYWNIRTFEIEGIEFPLVPGGSNRRS